jgi:hypothetical protein
MSPETPTPDAFSMLRDLIALAVNPSATRTRLAKLQKLLEQTAAAEQRLAERSARHDERITRDRKALEERKAALDARTHALMGREALAEKIIQRETAERRDRYQPMAEGMTIVRAPT